MIRKSNISGLTDTHLVNEFDCGNILVNNYLKTKALEDESNNTRSTTVYYDEKQLVSYYTTSTSIIEVKTAYDRKIFNGLRSLPKDNNQSIALHNYDDEQALMIPETYPLFVDIDSIVEIVGYLD
ncbi:hypothetical protein N692_11160 [Lactiplantibacillus plantarum EGD-AQ4]|nr:hypothetical protein N692_11160 [Lactiplantibacillus plantarum EGD-AQ4]